VDVYLEPLIEEFQKLWKGVPTFGTHQGATFNLKAMSMWSIHEFLTYGLFVGCVTEGFVGCPPCGPTTKSRSFKKFKKVVYCGNHCYLPRNHPYLRAWGDFNGETWNRVRPIHVTTTNTIKCGKEWKTWLQGLRNRIGAKQDLIHKHGIKQHNIMFKLPCWEVSLVSQNIDFYSNKSWCHMAPS
jgi:hypothetical protein